MKECKNPLISSPEEAEKVTMGVCGMRRVSARDLARVEKMSRHVMET